MVGGGVIFWVNIQTQIYLKGCKAAHQRVGENLIPIPGGEYPTEKLNSATVLHDLTKKWLMALQS